MTGALSQLRVLDLSRILAGPWATQILGDLGAEVIKVERPGSGDDTRGWGPPYVGEGEDQLAAYFISANRNKQSITVDFTHPEGQRLVQALAAKSDILVENYKVGGLAAYGLDYATLSALNPQLIYCSITGFGSEGPYAARAGYDFLIQGMGGLMSLTGAPAGEPGSSPMKVGVALTDVLTGLYASTSILAALEARHNTGVGQHIELALLDVQVACLANQALNYLSTGDSPKRLGNAHPNIVPYEAFPTADGDMILAVGNDAQFARFCEVAGSPEIAADEAYATNRARVSNRVTLIPMLRRITVTRTTAEWIAALEAVAVPCGPINTVQQVFADPQVMHRSLQLTQTHPRLGEVPQVASPIRLSQTPVAYPLAPPLLGEHTEAVLSATLGLTVAEIAALRAQGVI